MEIKNLWGDLPTAEEAGRSPRTILQQQANLLTEHSGRDLTGKVVPGRNDYGQIEHELIIIAPYLNNYEVSIVRASHGAVTYPVSVYDLTGGNLPMSECATEADFERALEKVLTSKKTRAIISSIRSQRPKGPAAPTGVRVT